MKFQRLLVVILATLPVAAFAASATYSAGGILSGYSDKSISVIYNSEIDIPADFKLDDGGRYIHWYGSDFSSTAQADIASALSNDTLTVDATQTISIGAIYTKAGAYADVSVVVCHDSTGSADPTADTACTCAGGEIIGAGTEPTFARKLKNNTNVWAAQTHTQTVSITLSAVGDVEFDDNSWVCAARTGEAAAERYGDLTNTTEKATATYSFTNPVLAW